MLGDVVGEGVHVQQHIDALNGGYFSGYVLEQQVSKVIERILNIVVLLMESVLLVTCGLRRLLLGKNLPQIRENHLLLIAEMLLHLLAELGVEVGDEGAVLPVHRLQELVEMVFDMGQLVLQVVFVRGDEILQNIGHPALLQLTGGREVVLQTIDADNEGEQRQRDTMLLAQLFDAFLTKTEGNTESWQHG